MSIVPCSWSSHTVIQWVYQFTLRSATYVSLTFKSEFWNPCKSVKHCQSDVFLMECECYSQPAGTLYIPVVNCVRRITDLGVKLPSMVKLSFRSPTIWMLVPELPGHWPPKFIGNPWKSQGNPDTYFITVLYWVIINCSPFDDLTHIGDIVKNVSI